MASKVEQLHHYLFRSIRANTIVDKIPTEAELCQRFNISRGTVRAAVKQLIDNGSLIARQGAGVFINHNKSFGGDKNLIATIIGDARNSYYFGENLLILSSIMRSVFQNKDLYISLDEIAGSTENLSETLLQVMPDGVLWRNPILENIVKVQDFNIPIVAIWALVDSKTRHERYDFFTEISGVFIDRFQEGYLYAMHCINKGFEKLLLVRPGNSKLTSGDIFFKGIAAAFEECGIDYKKNLRHIDSDAVDCSKIRRTLQKGFRGIYSTDTTFVFLQKLLTELELQYNIDYCLIARSQSSMKSIIEPNNCELVDFPHELMAIKAVELLNKRIDAPNSDPEHIFIPPRIISCNMKVDSL